MILKFYIMRFEQTNHFIYKKNFKKTHRLGARKRFLLRYEVKKISIGPTALIDVAVVRLSDARFA